MDKLKGEYQALRATQSDARIVATLEAIGGTEKETMGLHVHVDVNTKDIKTRLEVTESVFTEQCHVWSDHPCQPGPNLYPG